MPLNPVQLTLAVAVLIFVVLYLRHPRNPHGAMLYLRYALLAAAAFMILAPFFWLVSAVFKHPDVLNEYVFLPPPHRWFEELSLENLRELFQPIESRAGTYQFWLYVANSLFLACAQTTIQLFFCSLGGFALAKYRFRGQHAIMGFMLASMMIPPILLLAPVYGIIANLGLIDTYGSLLLPGAVNVFGIFLFRQAMLNVPKDLIEAGRIDGCSEFRIYWTLAMPLVRPMTGAFCLVAFLQAWNAFVAPNVFLQSAHKLTLPVVLQQYVGEYTQQYGVFLAGTLIAIIPPAILFFALEREFVSGLTSGSVKG